MPDIYDILVNERKNLPIERWLWKGIKRRKWMREYSRLELALLEQFKKQLSAGSIVELYGFVTRIRGRKFILRPSPTILDGAAIVCNADRIRSLPYDYDFVRVRGYRKVSVSEGLLKINDKMLVLDEVEPVDLPEEHLRPDISPSDAEDLLLDGYVDAPSSLKSSLLYSLVSSPKDAFRLGGLTASLMPLENDYSSSIPPLLRDIKNTIPLDITSEKTEQVGIRGLGSVDIAPFSWNIYNTSSSPDSRESKIVSRTPSASLNEITIGISANSIAPERLDELWIRRTDLPSIVDVKLECYRAVKGCDLELAKFLITTHINMPSSTQEVENSLHDLVKNKLAKIKRKYDPDGYGGLVDFDINYGSPRVVLHIAKTLARANGRGKVNEVMLYEGLDMFVDSRTSVFESWADKGITYGRKTVDEKLRYTGRIGRSIYKYIYDNPKNSKSEIREAFPKISDQLFESSFSQLYDDGLIYRTDEVDDRYSAVSD